MTSPKDTFDLDGAGVPAQTNEGRGISGYDLGSEVARGGMGRIVAAHDKRLDRPVAIKQLLGGSPSLLARFEREARITARLQHPSIVPIYEAGEDAEGRPFYAMKLVEGRTLREAGEAAGNLDERLGLLPAMTAVCEAVAYAHDRGVIHRDIKPANVLIGDFGETQVIDWGLAKELGTADLEITGEMSLPGPDLTSAGSVVGTPAFMAPEQASGRPATTGSDVYALGALMYATLSGRPPFDGADALTVIAQVTSQPPRALPPDIPNDLRAIVERAMSRTSASRPTARELATELRRWQTGQLVKSHAYSSRELLTRWARRNRAPLIVAAVALLAFSMGAAFSLARIVEARDEALQRRDAAEGLVGVVVEDLRDQLERVGQLALLDTVGGSVEAYYGTLESLAPNEGGANRATALATLGKVRRGTGDLEGALRAHREALETRLSLGAAAEVVDSRSQLAGVLVALGNLDEALEEAELAREQARALDDGSAEAGLRLARSEMALGSVHFSAGRARQAIAAQEAAEDALRPGADARSLSLLRASIATHLARAHWQQGAYPRARKRADRAEAEAASAWALDPGSMTWRERLAQIHLLSAHIEVDSGDAATALESIGQAEGLLQQLVEWDAANTSWRLSLVTAVSLRAHVEKEVALPADVQLATNRRVLRLAEEVLELEPTNSQARSRVALARTNLASQRRSFAKKGPEGDADRRQATEELKASLPEHEGVCEATPGRADYANLLSQVWLMYGEWRMVDGQNGEAVDAYAEAMNVVETVDNRAENAHKWHGDRMRIETALGEAHLNMADRGAAERHVKRAISHLDAMEQEGIRELDRRELLPRLAEVVDALGLPRPPSLGRD